MKKFAFLTLGLMLAACGGGSGGDGAPGAPFIPSSGGLTDAQRAAAISSNSHVTTMNSFIIVGGDNPTVNPNARIPVVLVDGGVRYDLSDVEFKTASMLMNTGVNDSATITFNTTDGKINNIILRVDGVDYDDSTTDIHLDINANRVADTSRFEGTGFFQAGDEREDLDEGSGFGLLYTSFSEKYKTDLNNTGLSYADFGVVDWGEPSNYDTSNYFAGGYDVKRTDVDANGNHDYEKMNLLAQNNTEHKLKFSGVADAVIRIGDMSDDADTHYTEGVNKLSLKSQTATLEFSEGTSTLDVKFANWYDVLATMDGNGKLNYLKFYNGDKAGFYTATEAGEDGLINSFKWRDDVGDGTLESDWGSTDELVAHATGSGYDMPTGFACSPGDGDCRRTIVRDGFVEYYGDNGNPAEVVGVIRYADANGNPVKGSFSTSNASSDAMRFDMGYGMLPEQPAEP